MKALTVQQPWAWALLHGKDIENRTTAWKYRGPLAIHAGSRWSERGGSSPLVLDALLDDDARWSGVMDHEPPPHGGPLRLRRGAVRMGAIIGVVNLAAVHTAGPGCCTSPWGEEDQEPGRLVHLEVADPVTLPCPVPAKGRLGLWDPEPDVLAAVAEQLDAVLSQLGGVTS